MYRLGCLILGCPFLDVPGTCSFSLLGVGLGEPYGRVEGPVRQGMRGAQGEGSATT